MSKRAITLISWAVMKNSRYSNIQVILVGGICGEFLALPFVGRYMVCLRPIIQRILPGATVSVVQPHFLKSIAETAQSISDQVREGYFYHKQQTILIGHSRGALECMQAAVNNPDLLDLNMLKALIVMAAPFKGSPIANFLINILRFFGLKWRALEEIAVGQQNESMWFVKSQKQQKKLEDITHLIRYEVADHDPVCWPLVFSRIILKKKNLPSDGLTPVSSQILPWSPRRTIFRPYHHGYDTCAATLSTGTIREKYNFFTDCFNFIFSDEKTTTERLTVAVRSFSAATYNVGGLKIPVWGVPFPRTRWNEIVRIISQKNIEIIYFQELFGHRIRERLEEIFPDYCVVTSPTRPRNGLAILVKRDLLASNQQIDSQYHRFDSQRVFEPLVGFEKGYMTCAINIPDSSHPILLVNLHLTAFRSAYKIRQQQKNQIIRHLRQLTSNGTQSGHIIVGGDFNETLRLPWALNEPSYTVETQLHKMKHWLNKNEPTQNVDYIFTLSNSENEDLVVHDIFLDFKDEKIKVNSKKHGEQNIELSDHRMVNSILSLQKVTQ